MKILFLGDIHGDDELFEKALYSADRQQVDLIIQVGDLGYFPRLYPKALNEYSNYLDIPFYFIDGNHEDHFSLNHNALESVEIGRNLFYLPRGYILNFKGLNFLFIGGAFSIDRQFRTLSVDYFEEETINKVQFDRAYFQLNIDVIVSHEAPYIPPNFKPLTGMENDYSRLAIKELYKYHKPKLLIHGHYHYRYHSLKEYGHIVGLGCKDENNKFFLNI